MIEFKVKIPELLLPLCNKEIIDFISDELDGIMEQSMAGQLAHCSMYIICELDFVNGKCIWRNPIAVVAKNEGAAMEMYGEYTHKTNGGVLCAMYDRCDNVSVSV